MLVFLRVYCMIELIFLFSLSSTMCFGGHLRERETGKKVCTHGVHVLGRSRFLRICCTVILGKKDFVRMNAEQV